MSFFLRPQERQLREVYTAIDRENYNDAIKLCQKPALADNLTAKALMAYSLAVIRKTAEALSVCRAIIATNIVDPEVLSLTHQALKVCKCENEILPAYEFASNANPSDENMMKDLFFCHVRAQDSKKMQQISQKLYKLTGNYSYVFWTVSSMMLQAELPSNLLVLMEKMISKIIIDTAPQNQYQPGAEEMELYIATLTKQKKYTEALEKLTVLLARPLGPVLSDGSDFEKNPGKVKMQILRGLNMKADLLLILKNFDALYLHQLEILKLFPDQWECHLSIIDNYVFNNEVTSKPLEERMLSFLSFVKDLQKSHSFLRGPRLSEITIFLKFIETNEDLMRIWPSSSNQTSIEDEMFALLSSYIASFSRKQCCFSDVRPIILDISVKFPKIEKIVIDRLAVWVTSQVEKYRTDLNALSDSLKLEVGSEKLVADSGNKKYGGGGGAGGKQSKGKKSNKTMNEQLKDLVGSFNENPRESLRQRAVECTCSIAKYFQIHSFINLVIRKTEAKLLHPSISLNDSYSLYQASKSLCDGGIGGDREVQPGDELLLVHSFLFRHHFQNATDAGTSDSDLMSKIGLCLDWTNFLNRGVQESPHAFTFRADLIEPLRFLGLAEPSCEAFNGLRVKHVQFDSMSYLICPTLEECGYFNELLLQHSSVKGFHNSAKRETLDMISKAFKFSNYMKTMELRRFVELCESSLQLALSRSEFPILKIINHFHNVGDASNYLKEHFKESSPDLAISPSTFEQLHLLNDNCDYSLTIRIDSNIDNEQKERAARRIEMERRIILNQAYAILIHNALNLQLLDTNSSDESSTGSCEKMTQMMSLIKELLSEKLYQSSSSSALVSGSSRGKLPWDQSISIGNAQFFTTILSFIQSFTDLLISLSNLKLKEESSNTSTLAIIALLQGQMSEIEAYVSSNRLAAPGLFCSMEFIHSISAFCKYFLPYVPILCQKIVSESRKLKKHKAVDILECHRPLIGQLESFPGFICASLEKIRETLHSESTRSETTALKEAVRGFAQQVVSNFTLSTASSSSAAASPSAPAGPLFDKLINQIISSQKASFNNMKTCLRDKIQSLQFALK